MSDLQELIPAKLKRILRPAISYKQLSSLQLGYCGLVQEMPAIIF